MGVTVASLDEQARKVLLALEGKPDLFFAVLRLALDEFMVVGPWVIPTIRPNMVDEWWERHYPNGDVAGLVYKDTNGTYSWKCGAYDQGTEKDPVCARNVVDNLLADQGNLIARGDQ